MTYLDAIAEEIRGQVPTELLPDQDVGSLFRLYAVLALAKGEQVTAADVHNAWSAWMQGSGESHRSLRPFEELDADVQSSDEPFVVAIRQVARERTRRELAAS